MSKEIKNAEIVAEENEVMAVPEEKKEGFVKKAGGFVKANWKKVLTFGLVGVGSFLLGAHTAGKSKGCDVEDCDVIEADDYTVEDAD